MRFLAVAVLTALVVTLCSIDTVKADNCRTVHCNTYTQTYTPTYQTHQTYDYNNVVFQPYAIPITIVPYTYFAVAPELAYARVNQELADAAAEKALRRFLDERVNLTPMAPTAPVAMPAPPKPEVKIPPAAPSNPPLASLPAGKDPTALQAVKLVINAKCIRCHQPGGEYAEFDLRDPSRLSRSDRLEMVARIMTDNPKEKMPKGKDNVSPEELNAFHTFAMEAPKVALK